ncbi:MAG: hypothetical protein ACNA7M_01260 [Roseovarius sp.]
MKEVTIIGVDLAKNVFQLGAKGGVGHCHARTSGTSRVYLPDD